MFNSKYTMEIISHHPQFKSRTLKKYAVEGVDTVGAWGNEPFEIKFKNNTSRDVQVKLSIDGTDVITGQPATTNSAGQMWLVKGYGILSLKAWPESQKGGAAFVFTSSDNSVALNTHGNMSCRGIIAAAVFEEGYVEPVAVYVPIILNNYDYGRIDDRARLRRSLNNVSTCSTNGATKSCDSFSLNEISDCDFSADVRSEASVGAGSYVSQNISYTTGLKKPVLAETIMVKYLWWDDLKAKLDKYAIVSEQPTGFPGDPSHKMIDLKSTPRLNTPQEKHGVFRRSEQQETWTRF